MKFAHPAATRLSLVAACCLVALLPARAWAEKPDFGDQIKFGTGRDNTRAVLTGDFNDDGHLDIAVGNYGQQDVVYLNDRTGGFLDGVPSSCDAPQETARCFGDGTDPTTTLATGDLDADGDLDLVVGYNGRQSAIYLNDGQGNFTLAIPFGPETVQARSVALGDVNDDGALDIAVGNYDGQNAVYLNQGRARFFKGEVDACSQDSAEYRCFGGARTESLALGDVNGDSRLDIVVVGNDIAGQGAQNAVYLNDGRGSFLNEPPSACAAEGGACFGSEAARARRVALGDMDGDDDLDLVVTFAGHFSTLYLNDGAGQYTVSQTLGSPSAVTPGLMLADMNGDGALDIVTGLSLGENMIYMNDGTGRFDGPGKSAPFGTGSDITFAVASADVDDDGDLDLITGNYRKRNLVYLNDGAGVVPSARPLGAVGEAATSVFLGDVDWDGNLDVVAGGADQPNRVYINDGQAGFETVKVFGEALDIRGLTLGNLDGDGDLDAVTAPRGRGILVYSNYGKGDFETGVEFGHPNPTAIALADVDADGDLDIIAGHAGADAPVYNLPALDTEDDDAAIPVAIGETPSYIYLNDGAGGFTWPGAERLLGNGVAHIRALAVGDLDGDGDPDIAAGNNGPQSGERNTIYLNDGLGGFDAPDAVRILPGDPDNTNSIVMGDLDGDGDLDLAVGNGGVDGRRNFVYFNDGAANFAAGHSFGDERFLTSHLALTDWDGDGDLDIINSFADASSAVYLNDGFGAFPSWRSFPAGVLAAASAGDLDGDGDPDIVGVSAGGNMTVLNRTRQPARLPNQVGSAYVVRPGADPDAERIASNFSVRQQQIPVRYGLYDANGDGVRRIELEYSDTGGGSWKDAVAGAGTVTTTLPTQSAPSVEGRIAQTYRWETFDSGLVDQNDNVALRLKAYPDFRPVKGGVPDPQQWPYVAAATYPFRVTGRQIRVFSDTLATENVVAGAYVLRLPANQVTGAKPLTDSAGEPLITDARGYLRGGGQILPGDRLFAMLPVSATQSHTLYYTSGAPTETGVEWNTVPKSGGSQQLVVSADNPLILFNMDLSLEWDARNDAGFLEELEAAINRSSEVFYDVSNGRMALGNVRIHQAKEAWLGADVVMYADNGVRPRASMGGVVDQPTSDVISPTKTIEDAFFPGQIRMGPVWDPFGESRSDLGQDWQRAFAHEWGHYYLYLPDNYLGYDEDGAITAVDCIGSFMTTAYDDEYSEFLNASQWAEKRRNCWKTVADQLTGRADWETIRKFYPEVGDPVSVRGPSALPLAVTQVFREDPASPAKTIPARNVDLRSATTAERLIVPKGYAYLFKSNGTIAPGDDEIIALGPTSKADHIKVRGATPGDRLCVFDNSADPALIGCIRNLRADLSSIPMAEVSDWQPNIRIQPTQIPMAGLTVTRTVDADPARDLPSAVITSSLPLSPTAAIGVTRVITETLPMFRPALAITVTQPLEAGQLNVQIVPAYGPPGGGKVVSPVTQMTPVGDGEARVFTQVVPLDYPAYSGFVRIWVEGSPKEAISQFFVDPLTWDAWQPAGGLSVQGDLGPNSRGGLGPNSRGGLGPNSRGGLGPNSRGGLGPNSRGGLGPNSRGGLGPNSRGGLGPNSRGGLGADTRAWGANRRSFDAPIASADGQVTIFNSENVLADTGTSSLLALPAVPGLPDWFTTVGQGYRFLATQSIPRTIAFNYLQRDVPDGYEHTLQLYFSGDDGETWQPLDSKLDTVENLATAPAEESGIYALIATIDIPVYVSGWNLFSYPVPESRPVAEALASVDGQYSTVYGYDSQDPANPWKVYNVDAPEWVNDLERLEFGRGYWINAREPFTLQLKVATAITTTAIARPIGSISTETASGRRPPPAIYYGTIIPDAGFAPEVGRPVTAWIGGAMCGEGNTSADGSGGVRYSVKVAGAEVGQNPVCGAPESEIAFRVGDVIMEPATTWDNSRPREHDLRRSAMQTP